MIIPNNISTIRTRTTMADHHHKEGIMSSAATIASSAPNWWPGYGQHVHANSLSSWAINNTNPNWNPQNPNSSSYSSGEEDISVSTFFTTASSHSGLTVHPTSRLVDQGGVLTNHENSESNHLWNHALLSTVRNNGDSHKNHDVGDNLIHAFPSKNLSDGLFEPACDYLKKMDNDWDIANYEKNFNGYGNSMFDTERLTKPSNSVCNWSIAPPDPEISSHFNPLLSCSISLSPTADQYSIPNINQKLFGSYSPHDLKVENEAEANHDNLLSGSINSTNGFGYPVEMNNAFGGDNNKFYSDVQDVSCNNDKNLEDLSHLTSYVHKPWMSMKESKPILKSLIISDSKKQTLQVNHTTRSNRKGHVLGNEGKRKQQCQENSNIKKPRHESSIVSSAKVPNAQQREKITALQQIVSPFGKTDQASVLREVIDHIKNLQEHIQAINIGLLSNPYVKNNTNTTKDPWGGTDRKVMGHAEVDLKSRGLCLVPLSYIPQAYSENIGPADYLSTPAAYRGCLYR